MTALDAWIEARRGDAIAGLLRCISSQQTKIRTGFGQTIVPRRGSIVASAVIASYDPDPDYFFHWFRDSALIVDALRYLHVKPCEDINALQALKDFVAFSIAVQSLDGRQLITHASWRDSVQPDFRRYLRDEEDLARVHGQLLEAETRINPDGSLDISRWPRPQHNGSALRALALIRWSEHGLAASLQNDVASLIVRDLMYVEHHAEQSCFDIWEEEKGFHYYT